MKTKGHPAWQAALHNEGLPLASSGLLTWGPGRAGSGPRGDEVKIHISQAVNDASMPRARHPPENRIDHARPNSCNCDSNGAATPGQIPSRRGSWERPTEGSAG